MVKCGHFYLKEDIRQNKNSWKNYKWRSIVVPFKNNRIQQCWIDINIHQQTVEDGFKSILFTNQWVASQLIHLLAVAQTTRPSEVYRRKRCAWCESDTYVALLMHIVCLLSKTIHLIWLPPQAFLLHSTNAKTFSCCASKKRKKNNF